MTAWPEIVVLITRLRRPLLTLLAVWVSYFLVVNWFIRPLNKILVFDIPLGVCLAVQGAAILFAVTLFRVVRNVE